MLGQFSVSGNNLERGSAFGDGFAYFPQADNAAGLTYQVVAEGELGIQPFAGANETLGFTDAPGQAQHQRQIGRAHV